MNWKYLYEKKLKPRAGGHAWLAAGAVLFVGLPSPVGVGVPLAPPPPPFEYWATPTSQIGMPDGRYGTMITPEGDLYTGYHEFILAYGEGMAPGKITSKTWLGGGIPVVRYHQQQDGILYTVEMFGTTLDGTNAGHLADLVSVTATNTRDVPHEAVLTGGFRYRGEGIYRSKKRVSFNPDWMYGYRGNVATRGGRILGVMPGSPSRREGRPGEFHPIENNAGKPTRFRGSEAGVGPSTPVLRSQYAATLPPGGQKRWVFKIPHPITGMEERAALQRLNYDAEKARIVKLWEGLLNRSATFYVPDEKLNGLTRASITNTFIGRDTQDGWIIPRVNELHYDGFYFRDGAFMVRALDLLGYHKEARQNLDYFLHRQRQNGVFQSQAGQLDGWGQALWSLGQHRRITGDEEFARQILPSMERAVGWLKHARRTSDHLGLMEQGNRFKEPDAPLPHVSLPEQGGLLPPMDPRDNEQTYGHLFTHDFWAHGGLLEAVQLAKSLNATRQAQEWDRELSDYRRAILTAVSQATRRTGGYIPPAVEPGGYDWGNFKANYPSGVLPPDHPAVTATIQHARSQFTEGMMTYAERDMIHGYLGYDIPMTELRRGESEKALDALLSSAAHTTGANGGFEYGSASRRDFGKNLSPHGCWAAKHLALLRDMLLREDSDTLHLGSSLSPAWVVPGEAVRVVNAPTDFGPVSYTLEGKPGGAILTLQPPKGERAKRLKKVVLHTPVQASFTGAAVENGGAKWDSHAVTLTPRSQTVTVSWSLPKDTSRWTSLAYLKRYALPQIVR